MDIVTYGALNKKVGEKLSSNQGTQNAGKMLGINNEGEIQPIQVLGGNVSVTETLESGEDYSMVIEEGETTAVTSVAGKYGTVTLDAGDIEYDEQEVYNSGTVGKEVGDLKSHLDAVTKVTESWENLNAPTVIPNYRIDNNGTYYSATGSSAGNIEYFHIAEPGTYNFVASTSSNLQWFVYNGQISAVTDFVKDNLKEKIASTNSNITVVLSANSTIAASARSTDYTVTGKILRTGILLSDTLSLTPQMLEEVNRNIISYDNGTVPTDTLLYADRLPSYYIEASSDPTSFTEAQSYMDNKIASLPKNGKQFIFITDVHWAGNQKHSTDMIQYIRKCTGIRKVLFGGDIFGNATTKYLAAKVAAEYLNQSKRAFGRDYIPCVGDHDNNTVNASADAYLPDTVLVPMFVGELERMEDYHCYAPYAKLSTFATPGTDDFIGAMDFFKSVYYVDDTIDKVRYIVLNNGNGGNRGAMYDIFGTSGSSLLRLQFDWLAEVLMATPENFDVIVLSHKGPSGFSGTSGNALQVLLAQFVQKNPSAYPHPSSAGNAVDQWWPNTTRYDFSNAPNINHLVCLMGHSHYDSLTMFGYTSGAFAYAANIESGSTVLQNPSESMSQNVQIPVINTATDSSGAAESTSPSMTNGTVTEQCFDVITLTDNQIIMTRFGAGEDRVLNWGS